MPPLHFDVKEHVIPCQYIREYAGATLNDQEDTLQLHIKQYVPKEQAHGPRPVTIVGAHANGFPKELYEPFWDELYEALKVRGQPIRSIWIADVASQGQSGVMNEEKLGNDRRTQLAYIHPRLLSSLVLVDPVIHDAGPTTSKLRTTSNFARSSTFRRDIWSSRTKAAASFQKHPAYQTWDPRVLDLWIEYGLRQLPTALYPEDPSYSQESDQSEGLSTEGPSVTLTTTKAQEVLAYLRPNFDGKDSNGNLVANRRTHPDIDLSTTELYPFYRPEPPTVFKNLPHLRPSTLYLFGDTSELSFPAARKQKLDVTGTGVGGSGGVKEGRVKEVVLDGVGHLIPMVAPKDSALATADFLASDLERWRKDEEEFRKEWQAKSKLERTSISEEYKRQIGGDPKVKSPQKL
ncbi:hypothetical protein ACLMJK_004104 [Lecanora helva]